MIGDNLDTTSSFSLDAEFWSGAILKFSKVSSLLLSASGGTDLDTNTEAGTFSFAEASVFWKGFPVKVVESHLKTSVS